jgi:hypothetical protein
MRAQLAITKFHQHQYSSSLMSCPGRAGHAAASILSMPKSPTGRRRALQMGQGAERLMTAFVPYNSDTQMKSK